MRDFLDNLNSWIYNNIIRLSAFPKTVLVLSLVAISLWVLSRALKRTDKELKKKFPYGLYVMSLVLFVCAVLIATL